MWFLFFGNFCGSWCGNFLFVLRARVAFHASLIKTWLCLVRFPNCNSKWVWEPDLGYSSHKSSSSSSSNKVEVLHEALKPKVGMKSQKLILVECTCSLLYKIHPHIHYRHPHHLRPHHHLFNNIIN